MGIVDGNPDPAKSIRAHKVATQLAEHRPYGGVVPEIAARAHLDKLDDLIRAALEGAQVTLDDLDGVAATCGRTYRRRDGGGDDRQGHFGCA